MHSNGCAATAASATAAAVAAAASAAVENERAHRGSTETSYNIQTSLSFVIVHLDFICPHAAFHANPLFSLQLQDDYSSHVLAILVFYEYSYRLAIATE